MMEAMEGLLTRRSVRHFTTDPVRREDVEALLRAAMSAPTSGNAQDWRFVVIDQRERLDAIAGFHSSSAVLQEAPLAVLVCCDVQAEKNPGRWVLDAAAASQNLLLAAHALGLGGVWLAVWPLMDRCARFAALLGLPENIQPVTLIAIGHPREIPPPDDRYDTQKVHFNHW